MIIDIKGLNKAEVLAALYNLSGTRSVLAVHIPPMSVEQAQAILDEGDTYFDYLKAKVMKVELGGDTLDTRLYDRDNWDGAGKEALQHLLKPQIIMLVTVAEIIAFVKGRNVPLGTEVELMLSDKVLDIAQASGNTGKAVFAQLTNDPILAGVSSSTGDEVVATDNYYFLRIFKAKGPRVKVNVPNAVDVMAFYVVDFNTLRLHDQSNNLI